MADSRPYFIVEIFETLPNHEGQVPVIISPRDRVAQSCPQALGWSVQKFYRLYIRKFYIVF
jgi:hypothetical protein